MSLPEKYQRLARELGVVQLPGQSDEDFMRWLDNLCRHRGLLAKAKECGVRLHFGMTSVELREAICARQQVLLAEKGFTVDATVEIFDRRVRIVKIVATKGKNPAVTVHYWIIEPWDNANNRGRANHTSAEAMLKKGRVVS